VKNPEFKYEVLQCLSLNNLVAEKCRLEIKAN
jgi:hypothetical protein